MSRRRNPRPHRTYVELQLVCDACGSVLGSAYQYRDQHPRAGESVVDARAGQLVERPQGGEKLTARCSSHTPPRTLQKVWADVVAELDQLDERTRWRDVLRLR